MKKQILNLGKALSKTEQRNVFGGEGEIFSSYLECTSFCRVAYGAFGVCCIYSELEWACDNGNTTSIPC